MQNNSSALTDVEKALIRHKIRYKKNPDGTITAGNLHLFAWGMTELPDFSKVIVTGSFSCANNRLTSLKGAPQSVAGTFYCDHNELTTLEGAPPAVGGSFYCSDNQLISLRHAPAVGDRASFGCENNRLASLEGAPQGFESLQSDFGKFASWRAVPEELRLSPETRARLERERQEKIAEEATVLQAPIYVQRPLRLRR